MSGLNPSRTIYNSEGKCLLENWVEERQVQERSLDSLPNSMKYENKSLPFKDGHKSILSTPTHEGQGTPLSTCTESYMLPPKLKVRTGGRKKELTERALYAQVAKELQEEAEEPPPMPEYKSVTQKDFDVEGFVSELPPPEMEHNVANEQPITFWTQHKQKIPGVTQEKTLDTPFRKNTSFSKPIDEYFNEAQPYDKEGYPWM
ncbi:sperm-associated antigen 8-like [Asterias amurensis]|uniref:sperm-associated antigen 8-like n=1 Tax=Asterias amurensis TaxID=7602 RepID=UPI003AB22344